MRCLVLAVLLLASPALAQDPLRRSPDPAFEALRADLREARALLDEMKRIDVPTRSIVTGALGVDFTTQYLFRGIPQEDQGVIGQPWVELSARLLEHDRSGLRAVDLTIGMWNSLHDGPTGGAGSVWYECDVYGAVAAQLGERVRCSARYTAYHSPNGSFGTVEEVGLGVSYDDRELVLPGGLQPSLLLAFETAGQADAGNDPGIFAEIGLRPTFRVGTIDSAVVDLSLPTKVGLSMRDYYEAQGGGADETLGYVSVGAAIAVTLPVGGGAPSPWRAELGLYYVSLGATNEQRNGNDGDELIATIGISTAF